MKNENLKDIREGEERREFLGDEELESLCIDYDEFDEEGNLISPFPSARTTPELEGLKSESEYE